MAHELIQHLLRQSRVIRAQRREKVRMVQRPQGAWRSCLASMSGQPLTGAGSARGQGCSSDKSLQKVWTVQGPRRVWRPCSASMSGQPSNQAQSTRGQGCSWRVQHPLMSGWTGEGAMRPCRISPMTLWSLPVPSSWLSRCLHTILSSFAFCQQIPAARQHLCLHDHKQHHHHGSSGTDLRASQDCPGTSIWANIRSIDRHRTTCTISDVTAHRASHA